MIGPFDPFANESDVLTVGDLTFENRVDEISMYGGITRDKIGLEAALTAMSILVNIIMTLRGDPKLPDKKEPPHGN